MAQQNDFQAQVPNGSVTTLWSSPTTKDVYGNTNPQAACGCTSFQVTNNGTTYILLVNIPGIHAANEWVPVWPGQTLVFTGFARQIYSVLAQGWYDKATGNTTLGTATLISYGPIAVTQVSNR